ncbi:MAG: 2-oxoacid:acceptor oxidoreductase subunit alpha [Candidatus Paceibacterota bacterium]|jgi:2-oxoglutarate ferredoxin oxidoreductase subunit alpha|nr:2-oxoacid:acceptor oxidoreductase subunit alpha [Candidatus Paceibacterota bacterium]
MRKLKANGNELIALAAEDAGCTFFAGYPITPSSEVMSILSKRFPLIERKFIQMEDEIGSICAAIGASLTGKRSMTNTSGPGMSLKAEQIGQAHMAEIPLVIVNVMRGGPATGLPTRTSQGDVLQSRAPTHGDVKTIVLAPSTTSECYTETVRAFNLAERFMQPVILLSDETLAHTSRDVLIPDLSEIQKTLVTRRVNYLSDYQPCDVKDDEPAILNPFFTGKPYHITGLFHDKTDFPTEKPDLCQQLIDRQFRKVDNHLRDIEKVEKYRYDDADYLIVCYGSVYLSARDAADTLRKEGLHVGIFCPKTLWPSPVKRLEDASKKFDASNILVVEMNKGQYLREVERAMGKRLPFLSKVNGRLFEPPEIMNKIREMHHGV